MVERTTMNMTVLARKQIAEVKYSMGFKDYAQVIDYMYSLHKSNSQSRQ
jgi:hypothetical protein